MASNNFIQGYKPVAAKVSAESSVIRWLFIKQHKVRDTVPEKPIDRTLFVINVPPFCNEISLAYTFSVCGQVVDVFCHAKPNASIPPQQSSEIFNKQQKLNIYKVAYVVFESPEGLSKALALNNDTHLILLHEPVLKVGIEKWKDEYNRAILDHNVLEKEIDAFMTEYDAEEKRKEHIAKMEGEADEDGWIMVTKTSRKHGIARTEAARKKILDKEKVKRSKKELKNFYTFQIRESKMKHLETLRKKFEEDKKKINAFKQSRKFKPF